MYNKHIIAIEITAMSASKSGDRSSRKTSKATVIEESVLTINLTVSPAAPVARASINYPVKLVRLRDRYTYRRTTTR